jgi:hypothetical protein
VEVVDGVGSGTLVGSTCMGKGGRTTGTGIGGMGAGAGVGAGEMGGGWERKIEGPGS